MNFFRTLVFWARSGSVQSLLAGARTVRLTCYLRPLAAAMATAHFHLSTSFSSQNTARRRNRVSGRRCSPRYDALRFSLAYSCCRGAGDVKTRDVNRKNAVPCHFWYGDKLSSGCINNMASKRVAATTRSWLCSASASTAYRGGAADRADCLRSCLRTGVCAGVAASIFSTAWRAGELEAAREHEHFLPLQP